MAVLRMYGFDEWGLLPNDTVPAALFQADGWTGSGGGVSRIAGRFGLGYAARFNKGGSNTINRYIPIGGRFSNGGGTFMFAFKSGGGEDWYVRLHDTVTNTYPIGFVIRSLARVSPYVNGAITFTSFPGSVVEGQWHWAEIKWTSGIPGSDTAEFHIDGEVIASYVNQTIGENIDIINIRASSGTPGVTIDVDDMVVQDLTGSAPNNDLLGNVRVGAQWADAPGDLTEFTVTGAATNWQASLNIALDPAIYVQTDTVADGDLYNLIANVPARTIFGIQAKGVFQQTDATQLYGATIMKTGGVEFPGVNRGLASGIRSQWDNWDINPDTGVAWTNSDLAALQVGPYLGASD